MVSMTISLPEDQAQRIATAICGINNYTPESPQDAITHVQQTVFSWLRNATLGYEADQAAEAIRANQDDPLINAVVTT